MYSHVSDVLTNANSHVSGSLTKLLGGVRLNAKNEEIHEDDLDELVSDFF